MRSISVKNLLVAVILLLWTCPVVAELRLCDGGIHGIDYTVNDYVVVCNETTVNVLDGASMDWLETYGASTINVSGGWMEWILADEGSMANIHGGTTLYALVWSGNQSISEINIFGCSGIEWLYADIDGVMTIHGSDFAVDGTPVGFIDLVGTSSGQFGQLTGTLLIGDPLNAVFEIYQNGRISLIPEPTTLLLLGLGGLGLLRRRRQA